METTLKAATDLPVPVNINPTAEDCYYYFYSVCSRGPGCRYRHCSAALGNEKVCELWMNGNCSRPLCVFRHSVPQRQRSVISCYWESQPSGCLRPHCPFKHSQPRPTPGPIDRIKQFNEMKQTMSFAAVKVKSLEELHHDKVSSAATEGPPPASMPTRSTSFRLKTVVAGTVVPTKHAAAVSTLRVEALSPASHSTPVKPTSAGPACMPRPPSIFSRVQRSGAGPSIFSATYQPRPAVGTSAPVNLKTSPRRQPLKMSLAVRLGPSPEPEPDPPQKVGAISVLSAGSKKKHTVEVSEKLPSLESKRLEAVETKVPQSKRLEAVETKVPLTGENSADFHVKTLDEIRAARKRKMKNADSTLSRKQPKSNGEPVSSLTTARSDRMIHHHDDRSEQKSASALKPRKKIVIRRKAVTVDQHKENEDQHRKKAPQLLTTNHSKQSTTPSESPSLAIESERTAHLEETGSKSGNRPPPTQNNTTSTDEEREGEGVSVKRIKLTRRITSESGGTEVRPRSIRRFSALRTQSGAQPSAVSDGTASPSADDSPEDTRQKQEESNFVPTLSDVETPLERTGSGGNGTRKRPSIAEMKAEIQSELHRHQSELHDDTFDRELLLLEEEQLMESDEEDEALALFDSKTDDDLMLDMEEFI